MEVGSWDGRCWGEGLMEVGSWGGGCWGEGLMEVGSWDVGVVWMWGSGWSFVPGCGPC